LPSNRRESVNSKLQKNLPFVAADLEEGADLVHRLYVARGFLDAIVDAPQYTFHNDTNQVDALIPIHEGRQYFFGDVAFTGKAIYDPATLRGQIVDLLKQPYTDARVADIRGVCRRITKRAVITT